MTFFQKPVCYILWAAVYIGMARVFPVSKIVSTPHIVKSGGVG